MSVRVDVDDAAAIARLDELQRMISDRRMTIQVTADTGSARAQIDEVTRARTVNINAHLADTGALRAQLDELTRDRTVNIRVDTHGADGELTTLRGHINGVGDDAEKNSVRASSAFRNIAIAAGVASAGIVGIGAAAALAGAGILAALPAAMGVAAAILLKDNAQVKASFQDLKTQGLDALKSAAAPMASAVAGALDTITRSLKQMEPAMRAAFAAAAPALVPLTQGLMDLARNVLPGLTVALRNVGPVVDGLKTGLANLGSGVSDMFRGLAAGAQGFGQAMNTTLTQVGSLLGTLGRSIGAMAQDGATALKGLLTGVNGLVGGLLQGMIPALHAVAGPMSDLFQTLGVGLGTALRTILPVIGQLVGALANALTPALKAILPALGPLIAAFLSGFLPVIKALTPVIVILANGLAAVMRVITPLAPAIAIMVTAWGAARLAVAAYAVTQTVVAVATRAWAAAQLALNIVMTANPIILIAAAVAILVVAIVLIATKTQFFQTIWNATWNGIKTATVVVWNFLRTQFLAFISVMTTSWTVISNAFKIAWSATWNAIKLASTTVWNAMVVAWRAVTSGFSTGWIAVSNAFKIAWSATWNAIKLASTTVWNAMVVAWRAVTSGFSTGWIAISNAFKIAWSATWNAIKLVATTVWNALTTAWRVCIQGISTIGTTLMNAFKIVWTAAWNGIKTAAMAVWTAMQAAWTAFLNAIRTLGTTAMNALKTAWDAAWNAIKTSARAVWDAMHDAWNAFLNAIKTLASTAMSALKSAWDTAWNAVKTAARAVWDAMHDAWNAFLNAIKTLSSDALNAIKSVWNTVWNAIKTAARAVWDAMHDAWNAFLNAIRTLGTAAMNFMHSAWNDFWNFFKSIATTVWNAVKSGFNTFSSAVQNTLSNLVDKAKSIWNKIVGFFKTPVNLVIGIWDVVAGAVGLPKIKKLATGGAVDGPGTSTSDSIPAMLSAGEFVMNAAAVSHYGVDTMHDMNNRRAGRQVESHAPVGFALGGPVNGIDPHLAPNIPHMAIGGIIPNPINIIKKAASGAAHLAKDAIDVATGLQKSVIDKLKNAVGGGLKAVAKPVLDGIVKAIPDPIPGIKKDAGSVPRAGVKKIADSALEKLSSADEATFSSKVGAIPSGDHLKIIDQALAAAGVPPPGTKSDWERGLNTLITRESGWNPNAINRSDSNAAAGHPSQGLAQTIPSTFAAYHVAGTSNNILDPVANIASAIRYIVSRYGNIRNVQQAFGSSPAGYANGTDNAAPGMAVVGERGPELVSFGGGEKVIPNHKISSAISSSSQSGGAAPSAGSLSGASGDDPSALASRQAAWMAYLNAVQSQSRITWDAVRSVQSNDMGAMSADASSYTTSAMRSFNESGSTIRDNWKGGWDTNKNVVNTDFTQIRNMSTTFTDTMKKQFLDTQTAISATWKATWEDAKTTANTDFTATQTATTTFWTGMKKQYTDGTSYLTGTFLPAVSDVMTKQLPASFTQSVTAIGTGWTNLKKTVRDPVAAVVDVVYNKGIVGVWNIIANAFGAKPLTAFTMPAFATGGAVNGPGTGTSDSITARLSAGEHVWTAAEVKAAGGHGSVAALRSGVLGRASVRTMGTNGAYAAGGGVPLDDNATSAPGTGTGTDALKGLSLGSIHQVSNPLITAAAKAGDAAIKAMFTGNPELLVAMTGMSDKMAKAVTDWITANDVAPTFGGANDAEAQKWADAQVGKPYSLGGNFGSTFDCSQYMSGIAKVILGQAASPWFTTFAFNGNTAPTGFKQGLKAPFMIGITNAGVGHTAGTLNGKNYEATPPAVRSGPSARGYNDGMFTNQYGFEPSISIAGGVIPAGAHLQVIDAALAAAGVPPPGDKASWEAGLNTLITRESNWNAGAINNTDSNAAAGIPSQGLAQVIPPTFAAYHVPGTSNNILDPVANVAAAIRYIVAVYGNISNVQQANANLPPKGYRRGTKNAASGWHMVGEGGPEAVNFGGGETVKSFEDVIAACKTATPADRQHMSELADAIRDNGGTTEISCPITINGASDPKEVSARVQQELLPKLQMMLNQNVGRRNR